MRKIILIILMFMGGVLYANELRTYVDGKVQFEVPESENLRYVTSLDDADKIRVIVNSIENDDILNWASYSFSDLLYKQLIEDGMKINKKNIIRLIENNDILRTNTFSIAANWYNYYGRIETHDSYLVSSYRKLMYKDQYIGEQFMDLTVKKNGFDMSHSSFWIDYYINFVINDKLVYIWLKHASGDFQGVYEAFPEWFELRDDGKYYWVNLQARDEFFNVFDGDGYVKLPPKIRLLRETRDSILQTLTIIDDE